jgi:hypothetical protein
VKKYPLARNCFLLIALGRPWSYVIAVCEAHTLRIQELNAVVLKARHECKMLRVMSHAIYSLIVQLKFNPSQLT